MDGNVVFAYAELGDPVVVLHDTLRFRVFYTSPRMKDEWETICYCAEESTASDIAQRLAAMLPASEYGGNVDATPTA